MLGFYIVLHILEFNITLFVIVHKTATTMAISLKDIKIENIRFKDPARHTFGNGETFYHRIAIQYFREDLNKLDDLVIMTNSVKSYGIKENRSSSVPGAKDKNGPVESYSLPIVIGDAEKAVIENIIELCRNHLCTKAVYGSLKKWTWAQIAPTIPSPFFSQKDDEGNDISLPTMYPKLMTLFKKIKDGEPPVISTEFYEYVNGEAKDIDPTELMNSATISGVAALHLRDIYIGGQNPSLQFRVTDFIVESRENGFKRKRLLNVYKPPDTSCVMDSIFSTTEEDIPSKEEQQDVVDDEPPPPQTFNPKIVRRQQQQ
jgi:Protein of unknown function (DUF2738)